MKTTKFLLLLLATTGIVVSTYFLFFRSGGGRGLWGGEEGPRVEEPEDLGGSLEADGKPREERGEGPKGRARAPEAEGSRRRSRSTPGGASLSLQLFLDGKPLAEARFRLSRVPNGTRMFETTDPNGRLRFEGLPKGRYVMETQDRRVPKSFRLGPYTLAKTQNLDLGRVDVPAAAALKFRLLRPDGRPLAGTELRLFHEGSFGLRGEGLGGKTDEKGRGSFFGLADGRWSLSVVTREYPVFEKGVRLNPGENIDLGDLRLERGYSLLGRVVDEQGKGLARVQLIPSVRKEGQGLKVETFDGRAAVLSDAKGRFRLVTGTKKGSLRVKKEGYLSQTVEYQAKQGELRIVLARTLGISGRVLGGIPGTTEVYAHRISMGTTGSGSLGERWKRATLGPEGRFHLDRIPPGEYGLLAYNPGKGVSEERRLRLLPGASQNVDLVLKPGPGLEVRVVNTTGKPLPGVSLALYYKSPFSRELKWGEPLAAEMVSGANGPMAEAKTGEGGRAVMKGLWKGKALLILRRKGLAKKLVSSLLLSAGRNVLRVEMQGAARIEGKAFGPDGKAIAGGRVSVTPLKSPETGAVVFSIGGSGPEGRVQADGGFHIEGIKPGRYKVSLKPPLNKTGASFFDGTEPSLDEKVVTLAAGEVARVTLRARPLWTIQGRVLFQGEPVAGATVSMKQRNPPRGFSFPKRMKTDREGRFRFLWVGPGNYAFHAIPPEKGVRTPAQVLDLPSGGGLRNLDLALGGGLVRGRITMDGGERPKGLELLLVPKAESETGQTQIAMVRVSTQGSGGSSQEQNIVLGDGPTPLVPNKDGQFEFHFVAPGDWVLKIRAGEKRGKSTIKSVPLSLAKNQGLDLGDISLEKTFPVRLDVRGEDGKPLELASVRIYPIQEGKSASQPVFRGMIRKGKALVPGLKVGSYKLVVRRISLSDPKPNPPQEGRLEVLPGGKVRGGVLQIR